LFPYILFEKYIYNFSSGNGQPSCQLGTGTVTIASNQNRLFGMAATQAGFTQLQQNTNTN